MTEQNTASDERINITMVYMGQRISSDGKRLYAWADLASHPNNGQACSGDSLSHYSSAIQRRAVPGEVYTFKAPADKPNTIYNNTGQAEESWRNRNQVMEWLAADEAAKAQIARNGRAARKVQGELENRLDPFRRAYHAAMTRAERAAILAILVNYVTS